jgi:hypothetical protein
MHERRSLVGQRWGSLSGGPVLYGDRHFRLVVYPPGTGDRERWLLRAWQWWPSVGPFLALITVAGLSGSIGPSAAAGLAATLFFAPYLWLRRILRRQRRDLSVVHAEYVSGPGSAADLARCRRLVFLSSTLTEAESAVGRGQLTLVDFQRVWGDVHAEARVLERSRRAA